MNYFKLASAVGLIFTLSCAPALAEDPIDTRISDMQSRKQLESKNLAKARHDLEEINKRLASYEEGQLELTQLREEIESYDTLIKADQEEFDSYQNQYKAELVAFEEAKKARILQAKATLRNAAIGEKIESLTTTKGKTYKNAVISAFTPFSMNLRHSAGIARIPFDQLPESYIKRFEFDAEEAKFALKLEKIQRSKQAALNANERNIRNNSTGGTNVAFIERQISRLRTRLSYYAQVKARNEANADSYEDQANNTVSRYNSSTDSYSTIYTNSSSRYRSKAKSSKSAASAAAVKVKQYEAEIAALEKKIRDAK